MTGYLRIAFLAVAALAVVALVFSRPPSDRADGEGASVVRTLETGPEGLARFHELALADEDTQLVDGSVDAGSATYATRSRSLIFLADTHYTTATLEGGVLTLSAPSAALRRGLEANRERLDFWITWLKENG